MPGKHSTDYRNIRPYVLEDARAIVQAAILGGLASKYGVALTPHRLDDTTTHIGTLDANQFPRGLLRDGSRSLQGNLPVDAGVTIDGVDISAHVADPDAHHARAHVLATAAGLGADHSMSGAADGQVLRANSATNAMWAYLSHNDLTGVTADQHHAKQHDITDAANHTVAGAAWSVVGATALNTLGLMLARSDATGTPKETLLKSDASGYLNLVRLIASDRLRTSLLDTASGNLTLQPAGDITIDPAGNDVLPATNYDINLGALSKKYLTLHAAELWVETLVAQNTIATIGGRILVGPTTTLTRDLAAAATTIYVKHNQMVSGDRAYMEANGSVEFFAVTSGATNTGTDYSYTVTRNLDGSGANDWYAGDAMFNTGQTGNGFIDLYSIRGVKTASQAGPTIVGNVRASATYNDWAERWALGNLNGLYGYGVDTYGFAAGVPSGTWIGADATNGLRIMRGSTARLQADTSGNLYLNNSAGTNVITLDGSGSSYFSGVMTIGTSGEIRQGTGTVGTNFTGLRIWRDSSIGRIAGYNSADALPQWNAGTDGKFYVGENRAWFDANGMHVVSPAGLDYAGGQNGVQWNCQGNVGYTAAYIAAFWSNTSSAPSGTLELYTERGGSYVSEIYLNTELVDVYGKLQLTGAKILAGSAILVRNVADSAYQAIKTGYVYNTAGLWYSDSIHEFRDGTSGSYNNVRINYVHNKAGVWYADSAQEFKDFSSGGYVATKAKAAYIESATNPGALTGLLAIWFDGTNLRATLPSGTTKTFTWT